jgi:hypothetical protein
LLYPSPAGRNEGAAGRILEVIVQEMSFAPTTEPAALQPFRLPRLSGREEELLLVAYAHRFSAEEEGRAHGAGCDWRRWSEAAGLTEPAARETVSGLIRRRFAEHADPDGKAIRITFSGVFHAEKSLIVESTCVAQQRAARRQILLALRYAFDLGGADAGWTIERLAAETGHRAGNVAANLALLEAVEFVASAGGSLFGITIDGMRALWTSRGRWPLD